MFTNYVNHTIVKKCKDSRVHHIAQPSKAITMELDKHKPLHPRPMCTCSVLLDRSGHSSENALVLDRDECIVSRGRLNIISTNAVMEQVLSPVYSGPQSTQSPPESHSMM